MQPEELPGKTITNIYSVVNMEVDGLDTAECFIELDNKLCIDIPYDTEQEVFVKELNNKAISLFSDLSDIPVYHVNKEHKTIGEIANDYQKQKGSILNRLRNYLFGTDPGIKAYKPYKTDYRENKLKYIKDRKITDFISYDELGERGYLLLENIYLITKTNTAPHGTGLAGLNYFESLSELIRLKGNGFIKLSEKKASR